MAEPQTLGKYEIQKKIGAGGMGAVYLALDPSLKRSCALKLLPQEKAKNPTLVRRFKAEAQAAHRPLEAEPAKPHVVDPVERVRDN